MTFDGRLEGQIRVPSGAGVTATNGATVVFIPVPANTYYLTDLLVMLQSQLNTYSGSATWTLTLSTGSNGTGQVTVNCTGTYSLAFTSVELRQLLGFAVNLTAVTGAQTGAAQARSLWLPDCPIAMDSDPAVAPTLSDLRATQSPTGTVLGLVGNYRYSHSNVRWTHVPLNKVWAVKEVLANQSYQTFIRDTQWAVGANELGLWFKTQSPCRIYGLNGLQVGTSLANGWSLIGVDAINPTLAAAPRTALYGITIPTIVSIGGP